jgi:TRAP transporter TAXI family solute receptor
MPKILQFSRFALRDLIVTAGPMILLLLLVCVAAYLLVDPSPPKVVTLSTGQENSSYEQFGRRYAEKLKKRGIEVRTVRSEGSQQNLDRLKDPKSGVDLAFVQSGTADPEHAEGLKSLGSLFTEPVWLFYREGRELTQLSQLKGLKVNIGPEGSGVPSMVRKILARNGLEPGDLQLGALDVTPAVVELLEGRIDALIFSSAPNTPMIQMLLQTPFIKLFDFNQAEAYTRRFPFMTQVTLPRGIVDLGRDLPPRDYHLVAPTATLVAREDLHPALVDLLVQAASEIHGGTGWFRRRGEYPNANYTEIPVARDAEKFYKSGPPLLQRYMPFWMANFFERMWVVIVALGALLLPLSRVLPPLYVWRVRSRVFRWYGELRSVEQAIQDVPPEKRAEVFATQLERLNEIEERVNQVSVPLSFAEELYGLRSHINFVRKLIARSLASPQQLVV